MNGPWQEQAASASYIAWGGAWGLNIVWAAQERQYAIGSKSDPSVVISIDDEFHIGKPSILGR